MKKSTAQPAVTSSSSEIDELVEFDSFDEAVAHAMSELEPGGTLSIHADGCGLTEDDGECTCTPLDLPIGAKA